MTERRSTIAPSTGGGRTLRRGAGALRRGRLSVAAIAEREGTEAPFGGPARSPADRALASEACPRSAPTTLDNGLPIHHVELEGTRAATVLVAFEAGARTERPEENGMAHFLEHLVFKGGEVYDDYRKVNETAEQMGAVLNAYTSHDVVAFHLTCRAEVVPQAIDLLTDFAGRPKIDADELDRERGVVVQEIARAKDTPSVVAEHLIDRAAFGDHPLGRPVLGPAGAHPELHARRDRRFRERQWAGSRGGAFLVGNLEHVPDDGALAETVRPLPRRSSRTAASSRRRRSSRRRWSRSATPTSRTCASPTARRSTRATSSSAPRWRSTRRCWAARWARACSTRSASSAGSPTRSTRSTTRSPTCRSCSSRPGSSPASAVEAYHCMRGIVDDLRENGPRAEEFERARAYAAGRRVLAFENTNAVARYAADQTVMFGEDIDPDRAIAALDETTLERVAEVARGISVEASVACVGPHESDEFA